MNTPMLQIVPVEDAHAGPRHESTEVVLMVARGGLFEGRHWKVGDRVICRLTTSRRTGLRVLIPRGKGSPMLGRCDMGRMSGVHGEPCHPARWTGAEVLEVRPAVARLAIAAKGRRAPPKQQLALFGEALAA